MAAITKASIKHQGGKKRNLFGTVIAILGFIALINFFSNQPDYGVELSTAGNNINKPGSSAVAVVSSDNDPFYPKDSGKHAYLFHHTPSGREGKEGHVIVDMLMFHAYTFHQNEIYGGSCGPGNDVGRDPERSLLKTIGLDGVLRFACPSEIDTPLRKNDVPKKNYQTDGVRGITPEYVDLLKSVVKYPEKKRTEYTIVVHISRDKFSPCRKKYKDYDPYLPNKHYQILIDKYMKPDAKVVIYSQEMSAESFDEFREKGYELHLDENIDDVWNAIMTADVFIMSRSSFSYAPAVVTKATVVYTPFWHKPIRGWDVVSKDVVAQSEPELQRLQAACTKKGHKFFNK